MLDSVDDVIEALGGPAAAAALTHVGAPAVSNWRARGRISRSKVFLIRDALAAKNLEASPSVFGFDVSEEVRA